MIAGRRRARGRRAARGRLRGAAARRLRARRRSPRSPALTALSILWSLYPSDSWVETNRTLAYLAAFAAGIAAVRLAREPLAGDPRGRAPRADRRQPLGPRDQGRARRGSRRTRSTRRLREPYGYWNAVGVTAAMAMPLCLWLGTREAGRRLVNALAWPLLGLLHRHDAPELLARKHRRRAGGHRALVRARSAAPAVARGAAALAARGGRRHGLGVQPERAHRRPRRARRPRGRRAWSSA